MEGVEVDPQKKKNTMGSKAKTGLLADYLANPSVGMDVDKLKEIWEAGVVDNQAGRSMLGSLLALPAFTYVDELHNYLKNHLLSLNISKAPSIGQIYLKAWKEAVGDRKEELEGSCVQDLIRCSLLLKRQVAAYCLEALRPFSAKNQLLAIDFMVYDLAEPLLWRSLEAKNNAVRFNAVSLLIMMFPFREKDQQPLEAKKLFDRQLKALNDCLSDDVEQIRITTVKGVGKILTLCWGSLCESDIRNFLSAFVNKLAWDSSSVGVRVAVYHALGAMLEEPESVATLENLLPKLAMGIHDRSESVRLAVVDLLLDTRPSKILRFWKIVPIDHIIRRLAAETSPSICERIARLLLPSYFPKDAEADPCVKRAVALLEANIVAARKFYQYAAHLAPVDVTVNHVLSFIACVYGCAKRGRANVSASSSSGDSSSDDNELESTVDKTNDTTLAESALKSADTATLVNLLDCAAILWRSIIAELKKGESKDATMLLHKKACGMVLRCVTFFEDPLIVDSLLVLVGCFTKASARYINSSLDKKVKAIVDEGFDPKLHGSLVETLCYVQFNDVAALVTKWWRSFSSPVLTSASNTPPPTKPKKVRISVPEVADTSKPRLGIQVIAYLLNRYGTRKSILGAHVEQLRELEFELQELWEHCVSLPEVSTFDAHWTTEVLKLRSTVVCLLCSKEGGPVEASKFLASFMDLLRVTVWPVYDELMAMDGSVPDGGRQDRAKAILQTAFGIWSDFIMCGLCDDKTIVLATDLTKVVMGNDSHAAFFVETAQLTYHILDHIRNHRISSDVAMLLRPWFEQIAQFSTANGGLFDGMDEVTRLIDRFASLL